MKKGLPVDQGSWAIQAINPQSFGVTNGTNVTIDGTDYPVKDFAGVAFRSDTQVSMNGQTVTYKEGEFRATYGNESFTFVTAGAVVEVM